MKSSSPPVHVTIVEMWVLEPGVVPTIKVLPGTCMETAYKPFVHYNFTPLLGKWFLYQKHHTFELHGLLDTFFTCSTSCALYTVVTMFLEVLGCQIIPLTIISFLLHYLLFSLSFCFHQALLVLMGNHLPLPPDFH